MCGSWQVGDALYIPAGVMHRGVGGGTNLSVLLSIGLTRIGYPHTASECRVFTHLEERIKELRQQGGASKKEVVVVDAEYPELAMYENKSMWHRYAGDEVNRNPMWGTPVGIDPSYPWWWYWGQGLEMWGHRQVAGAALLLLGAALLGRALLLHHKTPRGGAKYAKDKAQ